MRSEGVLQKQAFEITPPVNLLLARVLLEVIRRKEEEETVKDFLPGLPKLSSMRYPKLHGILKSCSFGPVQGALMGALASTPFALSDVASGKLLRGLLLDPAIGASLGTSLMLNLKLLNKIKALKEVAK